METNRSPIQASQSERRRDARILVNAPVEIATVDHKGCEIIERTQIEDVSDFGCRFTMRGAVRKGDTVSIRLLAQDRKTLLDEPAKTFEVIWIARGASSVVVGARILEGEKIDTAKLLEQSGDFNLPAK